MKKEITAYQDSVIKAINLLFVEWGSIKIAEDAEFNAPIGGYIVANFILRNQSADVEQEFINILNRIGFDGIHCFPAPSGIVIEIFYKNPYMLD
jgi:hypothetical protein